MRITVCAVFLACALGGLLGRCEAQSDPEYLATKFAGRLKPSNSWQLSIREPAARPKDPVQQALRAARDRYADKVLGAHMPLDEMADKGLGYGEGGPSYSRIPDAVPEFPNRTVLVAQFTDFEVVLSDSRSAIYTELHLSVERILDSSVSHSPGTTITAIVNGGTVKLAGGRVLQFHASPRAFVPVPGGRYIFFLRRVPEGEFYLIAKSIELRDGKALPNSADDVDRAEHGTWPFLDQEEDLALRELDRRLRSQERGSK